MSCLRIVFPCVGGGAGMLSSKPLALGLVIVRFRGMRLFINFRFRLLSFGSLATRQLLHLVRFLSSLVQEVGSF